MARRCALIGAALVLPGLAAAEDTELSFWTNLTTAAQANVIQKQVNDCTAATPNVKVHFETVPFSSMYTRLVTALRKGDPPNVMNTLEGAVAFLQAKNGIVPVTDVVNGLGQDDFIPAYLHAASKGGQIWGVPDWALHQEVWYRKDLFAQAGLKPPKSWPELLQAAKALNREAKDGKPATYGFAVPMSSALVGPQTYFQIFYSAGGTVFDPKTGAYVFDKQKDIAVKSLQFLVDLYKAASPPSSVEWSWNEYRTAYVKGQVAMTNEWGAVVQMAVEQNPDMLKQMSVFPFPGPSADKKPAAALNGGYYYVVGNSTPAKVAASKELLKCLYKVDRVVERANTRPIFAVPSTKSAFNSAGYQSNEMVKRFKPEMDTIFNDVMQNWYRYGMEAGLNPLAGQIEATTFIGDALQNAALGKITVEKAVDQMNDQLKQQVAAMSR
ncbi:putative arabinose-binding protein precursor [Variovorax sp. PBL-E5]|nr:putative arabinose-binding protein precursor [Variovorax sp. SRS16]VTU17792.1 putative arabinose-binding protein precursor [Variovorax sp. PBL-E5]